MSIIKKHLHLIVALVFVVIALVIGLSDSSSTHAAVSVNPVPFKTTSTLNLFSPNPAISPSQYYTPGMGNPAVSTADYYLSNGLYFFRPYDLTKPECGAIGQQIASTRGRYVWLASADHPYGNSNWANGSDFLVGYSNDIGIPPTSMSSLIPIDNSMTPASTTQNYNLYQVPWLVCNPDDQTYPFYIYAEGLSNGGSPSIQHEEGLARFSDFKTSSMNLFGPTHLNSAYAGWSSFQKVVRLGTSNWYSTGLANPKQYTGNSKYISTDGLHWSITGPSISDTLPAGCSMSSPNCEQFSFGSADPVTYNGQLYLVVRDDMRNIDGGMYVSMVPVDSNYVPITTVPVIRLSPKYDDPSDPRTGTARLYPGPAYLQNVSATVEDGILHVWASHGFPNSGGMYGLVEGATYQNGGGLWEQFIDYYTFVIDPVAALASAPVGVNASASNGVVTLTWKDALPNNTYRLYRGLSATGPWTLVSDVSGTSITDQPTPLGQRYWYKVVTLDGTNERGSRVVSVYASSASAFVNQHVNRVLADGADPSTIDINWLTTVDNFLSNNNLYPYLLHWVDAGFGVKKNGNVISKIYDLGTTRLPSGGDYTPTTANTLYSPTALKNSVPGWTNTTTSSWGYFGAGKANNIRRKVQITLMASYQKPNNYTATLFGDNEFRGMSLQHLSGSPGSISFNLTDDPGYGGTLNSVTAIAPVNSSTATHVIAGTFDGTNVTAYADGVAGIQQTGLPSNTDMTKSTTLRGKWGTNNIPFLGSGSQYTKFVKTNGVWSYAFDNAQAQFTGGDLMVFEKGFDQGTISALTTLIQNHISPGGPTDTVAPTIPANLTTVAISSSQVNLSWSASTDNVAVAGYKIFRNGTQVGSSATTNYSDTGLSPSTVYNYTVKAYDSAGNVSDYSTASSVTTLQAPLDTTPPSAPTNLSGNTVSTSQVNLSWSASTDNVAVAGYKIFRNGTQVSTQTVTTYTDVGLSASTTYTYYVVAYDSAGNVSAQSNIVNLTTPSSIVVTVDSTPPVVSITSPISGSIVSGILTTTVQASDNVGVTKVEIYWNNSLAKTFTTPPYTVSGDSHGAPNGNYVITAKAYDAAGNTKVSSSATITISN